MDKKTEQNNPNWFAPQLFDLGDVSLSTEGMGSGGEDGMNMMEVGMSALLGGEGSGGIYF